MSKATTIEPKSQSTPEYDPYSAETLKDPYPIYRHMREREPLYYSQRHDFYALTRYDDIIDFGRDWKTFSYAQGADIDNSGDAFGPGNFLEEDPPSHTMMRDIIRHSFKPAVLRERLDRAIRQETEELLETAIEKGEIDYGADFAWALPMRVVASLLGFPQEDLEFLTRWEHDFARRELGHSTVPEFVIEASRQIRTYFAEQIETHHASDGDTVLSAIVKARSEGVLDIDTAASMAFLLWAAGTETTASLLTNGAVLLHAHPEQRRWLASNPDAIRGAVEEILRFESPLQVMRRTTTRDVRIHGVDVPSGASVFTVYGAANRDEQRFPNSEVLNLKREPKRTLAFGDGIHHCLGAPLARLEAEIAFPALLARCPEYEIDRSGLVRLENYITRGFEQVPMSL